MTEIHELSAGDLLAGIRAKRWSVHEAVSAHLDRIAEVNPAINAVVTVAPEAALEQAARQDRRLAAGGRLPPLFGLPMTHKDTNATAGMRTTQGSLVFRDHVPAADALIIARLRAAGVVSTGKSNVPEFGAGSHTFNEVFGITRNPYDVSRSAGGSSGGVAAAIAAGIQPLGEGSDMGGSLRIPASFCNVVGFRPSQGVIPLPVAENYWSWLARSGPMARCVDDIALFLSAVAGPEPTALPPAPLGGPDFAGPLRGELAGLRIGWSPDFGLGVPVEEEVLRVLRRRLAVFEEAGAIVEEAAPDLSRADEVFRVTRARDFAAGLGGIVAEHRELIKPEVVWNVELGRAATADDLIRAAEGRSRLADASRAFFAEYDLFLSPAAQVLPFDAELRYPAAVAGVPSESYLDWMRSACLISATGLPAIALPAGFTPGGLPVGFQLVADHFRDVPLLRAAKAFEERTGAATRRPEPARSAAGAGPASGPASARRCASSPPS